jgi:hypothetical protein
MLTYARVEFDRFQSRLDGAVRGTRESVSQPHGDSSVTTESNNAKKSRPRGRQPHESVTPPPTMLIAILRTVVGH